jgi:hypothetical protein
MRNWTWRGISIVLALLALPALAAIPSANKIAKAVAETNETSGRGGALLLDVQLRLNDREGPPAATGVIATHPTGLARMELKSALGFIERHLLQSDAYQASRNGELLEDDELHPFLPPVFLLQASSGEALSAALRSYGVSEFEVVLGRMDDQDCYVFGGRVVGSPDGEETLLPSLWVDVESYEPLRIVRDDGVEYRLGPPTLFDSIRVPTWVEITEPSGLSARLEVTRVAPATAPAASFQRDWLTAPVLARPQPQGFEPSASAPQGLR